MWSPTRQLRVVLPRMLLQAHHLVGCLLSILFKSTTAKSLTRLPLPSTVLMPAILPISSPAISMIGQPPPTPHLSHQTLPWMEITCMMVLKAQGVRHIPLFCLLPLSLPPLLPLPLSQCPHQTPVKTPTSTSLPCMASLLFLPLPLLLPR